MGNEPHEARADGPMPDASSNGASSRGDHPDPIALRATRSCAWTAQTRPLPEGEGRRTELSEAIEELCRQEWSSGHWLPLVNPDPSTQLCSRATTAASATSSGATLELQLTGGSWAAVPYECKWGDTPPRAYMDPALTDEARAAGSGPPRVDFAQPTQAILRWPQR